MWQNIKLYVLAYAIMVAGALVSSIFQIVGDQFAVGHPVGTVSANLSGMSIGGLIMVLGFIRDGRIEEERKRTAEERKRTETAQARTAVAEARAAAAEARIEREKERAEQERARAEAAEARTDRLIERYQAATESLIRRLEELNGDATDTRPNDPG
jgi:uncharacterized protein YaiL (DUF2058 family)